MAWWKFFFLHGSCNFATKNSYTEEMINLFAKFGFERLKAWAGGDQLSELSRNSNVLNIRSIKYRNNLDSIFIANKTIVLLHLYQCWSDVPRRLPIIGRLWCTASKQLVAPRCTSIRCHEDEECAHWHSDLCSDFKEEDENYVMHPSKRGTVVAFGVLVIFILLTERKFFLWETTITFLKEHHGGNDSFKWAMISGAVTQNVTLCLDWRSEL